MTADGAPRSERRTQMVGLAGDLFAEKGFRATTVREIADAAGILSGSLYHHFDSKESIADEILSSFLNEVLTDYRAAAASAGSPRAVLEQIVRSTSHTLSRHRAALAMLQNDWTYFAGQPRFGYLRKAVREIERTWITQLERGKESGDFRADLDVPADLPAAARRAVDPVAVAAGQRLQHRPGRGRLPPAAASTASRPSTRECANLGPALNTCRGLWLIIVIVETDHAAELGPCVGGVGEIRPGEVSMLELAVIKPSTVQISLYQASMAQIGEREAAVYKYNVVQPGVRENGT